MARRKSFEEKVTQTELIAIAYEKYDAMIREIKMTGDPEKDALLERYIRVPRKKCEILNLMYEIETGSKLFED